MRIAESAAEECLVYGRGGAGGGLTEERESVFGAEIEFTRVLF